MYSDTSVTGDFSGIVFRGNFMLRESQAALIIRFGKILLEPAGVTTLLLLLDYVDSDLIGLWPRCFCSSGSLTGMVMWLLFICQYIF